MKQGAAEWGDWEGNTLKTTFLKGVFKNMGQGDELWVSRSNYRANFSGILSSL